MLFTSRGAFLGAFLFGHIATFRKQVKHFAGVVEHRLDRKIYSDCLAASAYMIRLEAHEFAGSGVLYSLLKQFLLLGRVLPPRCVPEKLIA